MFVPVVVVLRECAFAVHSVVFSVAVPLVCVFHRRVYSLVSWGCCPFFFLHCSSLMGTWDCCDALFCRFRRVRPCLVVCVFFCPTQPRRSCVKGTDLYGLSFPMV